MEYKENKKPTEAEREESDAEYEDGDPFAGLYPTKKVEQWDCDTIISMILLFPLSPSSH